MTSFLSAREEKVALFVETVEGKKHGAYMLEG